jgi:hypothetical protein
MTICQTAEISGPEQVRPALNVNGNNIQHPTSNIQHPTSNIEPSIGNKLMKTILCLTLMCAATAHAQYSSKWSEFDSGRAAANGGSISHSSVFSGWLRKPMNSASYEIQQGYPGLPMPVQTPGLPVLTITLVGNNARVAWPASATNFTLEETDDIGNSASWAGVPGPYQESGGERFILVPASQPGRFYRLMAP